MRIELLILGAGVLGRVLERDDVAVDSRPPYAVPATARSSEITPRYASPDLPSWLTAAFYRVEKRATCINGRVDCGDGTNCQYCGTCCSSGACAPNLGNCCIGTTKSCDYGFACCSGASGCCYIAVSFCCSTATYGCCVLGQTCGASGCVGTGFVHLGRNLDLCLLN
jgi:hypothetical protein